MDKYDVVKKLLVMIFKCDNGMMVISLKNGVLTFRDIY